MNRTLVLQNPPETVLSGTGSAGWGMVGDLNSKPLPNLTRRQWLSKVARVHGPRDLRTLLKLTLEEMGELISWIVAKAYPKKHPRYTKYTVCNWEQPERGTELKRGYWKKHGMPRYVELAYHAAIMMVINIVTGGTYKVRVTGRRQWRVTVRRIQ